MSVIPGDVLRVVAQFLWTDGNVNQNVFNALLSGAGSPWSDADIADDAEAWMDNMYANLTSYTSDEIDGNEVVVYKYDVPGDDWDEVASQAFTWDPASTSDQLPRGTAPLVRLWTSDPDVQGKKYIPGQTEDSIIDGLYISALLIDLLAFASDWYLPFTGSVSGATWNPGVWSVAQKAFKTGVDHLAASAIPAYQRRRKRNVGI
jgi:hypothetical protein